MTEITKAMQDRANIEVAKQQKIVDRLEEKYNKLRLQMRELESELNAERHFLAHYKANAAWSEPAREINDEQVEEEYEEQLKAEYEENEDETSPEYEEPIGFTEEQLALINKDLPPEYDTYNDTDVIYMNEKRDQKISISKDST